MRTMSENKAKCPACGHEFVLAPGLPALPTDKIEWEARWSGGQKSSAVLVQDGDEGIEALSQSEFARHVRHVPGGNELWRADPQPGAVILWCCRSGSGRSEEVKVLYGPPGQWGSFDKAESHFGLPEGALKDAFFR